MLHNYNMQYNIHTNYYTMQHYIIVYSGISHAPTANCQLKHLLKPLSQLILAFQPTLICFLHILHGHLHSLCLTWLARCFTTIFLPWHL